MRKLLLVIIVLLFLLPAASSAYLEWSSNVSFEPLVPIQANGYGLLWGLGYELSIINDRFMIMAGAKTNYGTGSAVTSSESDGTHVFGLYKDEWFALETGVPLASTLNYISAELSLSVGWHISYLFDRRQFVILTFAGILENEKIPAYGIDNTGLRYASYITLTSEIADIMERPLHFRLTFGSIAYRHSIDAGVAVYYVKAGVNYEIPMTRKKDEFEGVKMYEIEDGRVVPKEEGEAVWEE